MGKKEADAKVGLTVSKSFDTVLYDTTQWANALKERIHNMKKLLSLMALVAVFAMIAPEVSAEQISKEDTITIVGGSSNTVTLVECYARGVGKAQANEIVKLGFYNPSATTTAKVDFAVLELDDTTYTSIASVDYTAGASTYVNNTPFKTFVTGVGGASSTNYNYTAYSTKKLRINLYQNATNAVGVTTSYKYQVYTR